LGINSVNCRQWRYHYFTFNSVNFRQWRYHHFTFNSYSLLKTISAVCQRKYKVFLDFALTDSIRVSRTSTMDVIFGKVFLKP